MNKRQIPLVVLLLAAIALTIIIFASRTKTAPPRPLPAAVTAEFKRFQGTWKFVSMEVEGRMKPAADVEKYTMVFTGDHWLVYVGTNQVADTPFEIDPSMDPKEIDLFPSDGRRLQGIYKIEGDTFTMCDRSSESGDRPTEFATTPDSGLVLVVLQRQAR